jgi:probable phosphoglycerate mutase
VTTAAGTGVWRRQPPRALYGGSIVRASRPLEGVVLARHGQTNDNLEPLRFQGFTDTPLNHTGRAQARELARRLADGEFDGLGRRLRALWSSDLSRARETAEIVGGEVGLEPVLDARLREASRGRWEGHTFAEIEAREPELYAQWRGLPAIWRFPDGESLREQQERVTAALTDMHAAGALPALAVCHGGSIRVMLCASDPRGLAAFHEFDVPNVAVVPL